MCFQTILNKDVDEWPECDCLLSWHSEGFPTEKALRYCEKQKPLLVNDLAKQPILFDRRRVYDVLQVCCFYNLNLISRPRSPVQMCFIQTIVLGSPGCKLYTSWMN